MAVAPRNQLPSGYDEKFVNEPEDEILCLICHLPQKEPVLTSCGHRFCKDCLEEHFRRKELEGKLLTCPVDMQTLDRDKGIFLDKATERKILSFNIKCPSDDCEWTGELRYKETHLASCPFKDVPCTNENCPVTVKRKDLNEHVGVTCEWRIITCEHCSEPHPKCQMKDHIREKCELCPVPCSYQCSTLIIKKLDLQDHLETCVKFPVRCPNNCEAVISREMIPNHIEDDCPLTKIPCPYARIGCSIEVQRDHLESHLQHETRSHLDLVCSELNNTQKKVKEKTIQVDRLEAAQKTIQKKLDGLEKRLEESVDVLQQQQRRQHRNRVNVLQQEYQDKLRILEQTVNNTTQTKLKQKLNTVFIVFFVGLLLSSVCLKLYLTNLEDRFQNNLEQKVSVSQRLFENDMGIVKKYLEDSFQNLEKKVSDFQSLHEKDVGRVKKNLEDKVDSLSTEITFYLKKLEDRVHNLETKLSDIKSMHEKDVAMLKKNLNDKVDSLRTDITRFNLRKLEDLDRVHNLETKVSDIKSLHEKDVAMLKKNLDDKVDSLSNEITTKVSDIKSLHEKDVAVVKKNLEDKVNSFSAHLRVTEESRKFTWKIRSFADKLKQAKNKQYIEIGSDPFYMYGYKLRLDLCPNGNGNGENTHLSVFMVVMKGKYDAILPWPFKKKVKLTLIDQQEDPAKRENVIMQFTPGNYPDSYARPTQEKNIGRGYHEFISHEKLHSRHYLVDDTLFLQVEIDPPFWS